MMSGWLLEHHYAIAATVSRRLQGNNNAVASVSWLSLGCFRWLPRHYYVVARHIMELLGSLGGYKFIVKWFLGCLCGC